MNKQVKRSKAKRQAAVPVRGKATSEAQPAHQFHRPTWLANILRERIIRGIYEPGTQIREANLHAEFGFSNGPIREALQLVVAEGLAERFPWQGVRVVALSQQQIIELFEVRLALLEYAAELAAARASQAALDAAPKLKKHIDSELAAIEAGNTHPSFQGELSRWLMDACGNEKLQKLWTNTMLQTLVYVNAAMTRNAGANLRPLMHDLVDSVVRGDRDGARAAARSLTRQTLREIGIDYEI